MGSACYSWTYYCQHIKVTGNIFCHGCPGNVQHHYFVNWLRQWNIKINNCYLWPWSLHEKGWFRSVADICSGVCNNFDLNIISGPSGMESDCAVCLCKILLFKLSITSQLITKLRHQLQQVIICWLIRLFVWWLET